MRLRSRNLPQYKSKEDFLLLKFLAPYIVPVLLIGGGRVLHFKKRLKKTTIPSEFIKENYKISQEIADIGSWTRDLANEKIHFSDEFYRIIEISPENFKGDLEEYFLLVHPDDLDEYKKTKLKELKGIEHEVGYRITTSKGIKYLHEKTRAIYDENGNPVKMVGIIQDITTHKTVGNSLREMEDNSFTKKIQFLVKESWDVFEIIEADGTIKYISEAVENVIGFKVEERIGKNVLDFYEGEEREKLSRMIEETIKEPRKKVKGTLVLKSKTGEEVYLEAIMKNAMSKPSIQGIIINFRNITERVEMEKKMVHISTHDDLTDLPNKVYFKKKLREQCEYADETGSKFALMILEIHDIRECNCTIGINCENCLLLDIVKRLKEVLGDIFLSRISEYKFAVIVQGIKTDEGYEKLAEEIVEVLKKEFIIDKFQINISANIGVCIYPDDANDSISIHKNANIALVRATREGKNKYKFFSSELDIQYYKEFVLRNDLHKAIENNQLKVYYQPIVNLNTSEIIAAEALIRWEHPDWGTMSPDEFMPLAEESDIIIDIGKWMLRDVCSDYKRWIKNKKSSIKVSVNFSITQFSENNFVENIINIIDEYNLDPKFLIIEITENIIISKFERMMYSIKKLQSYGIQIALDDFGTGYSSFSHLSSFKVDILKIDKSFINKVMKDKTNSLLTKTIINMAKELNIKLVAEGIENWDQLLYLRGQNCYAGQGYLYCNPIPAESFEIELDRGKCMPSFANNSSITKLKDRRKYFRIKFHQPLEAKMTVISFKSKNINVGNTKVLIKNIGPGGLLYVSNIKLPIDKDISMLFTTNLLGIEMKFYGSPVRIREKNGLYEYGIKFKLDEHERTGLIKILNQVQVKMKKDILFEEGSFFSGSPAMYFSLQN